MKVSKEFYKVPLNSAQDTYEISLTKLYVQYDFESLSVGISQHCLIETHPVHYQLKTYAQISLKKIIFVQFISHRTRFMCFIYRERKKNKKITHTQKYDTCLITCNNFKYTQAFVQIITVPRCEKCSF